MGAADVVPGVSGGTVAFITGIYEELVESIRSISGAGLRHLPKLDLRGFWSSINGGFLAALGFGLGVSVLGLSRGVLFALEHHPVILWSFFFGLLVGAIWSVAQQLRGLSVWEGAAGVVGAGLGLAILKLPPTSSPDSLLFVFLCGAIAICAMILPGVSGSFILVLLGKYEVVLGALRQMQVDIMAAFAFGCGLGLLAFSHLLSWLFRRFHSATIAAIIGFLVGSMPKLWPWKQTLETYVDRHGVLKPLVQKNVSPFHYAQLTGEDARLLLAIGAAAAGLGLVLVVEWWGRYPSAETRRGSSAAITGPKT